MCSLWHESYLHSARQDKDMYKSQVETECFLRKPWPRPIACIAGLHISNFNCLTECAGRKILKQGSSSIYFGAGLGDILWGEWVPFFSGNPVLGKPNLYKLAKMCLLSLDLKWWQTGFAIFPSQLKSVQSRADQECICRLFLQISRFHLYRRYHCLPWESISAVAWFLIRKSLLGVKEVVEFYADGPDLN